MYTRKTRLSVFNDLTVAMSTAPLQLRLSPVCGDRCRNGFSFEPSANRNFNQISDVAMRSNQQLYSLFPDRRVLTCSGKTHRRYPLESQGATVARRRLDPEGDGVAGLSSAVIKMSNCSRGELFSRLPSNLSFTRSCP